METAEKRTGRGKKAAFLLAAALLLAVFCTGCKGKQKEENEASGSGEYQIYYLDASGLKLSPCSYETETEEVPITSLNYLSTMALERAGIALPSYNQFLADMQQTIPAINSRGYYSVSSGCFKHLEEATGEEAEWINKYQILQYNNMFDKKKQSKVFFPYLQNQ